MNKILPFSMRALGSAFLSIALLSLNAGQARAVAPPPPSGYAIDILNANPSGLTVTINGSASADPYQGQGNSSQQRITVTSWGDNPNVPTTVNPNFTFSNPKKFTATWSASHTYAQSGTYTITAKVCHESCNQSNSNNQHNHSDTDTIQVTVTNPNLPPVLTNTPSGTVSIPALAPYTFDANATDPNSGDTLTFSLSGQPSGSSINGSTGVFTWTPSNGQANHTYTFTVRVSDGQLSNSKTVTLRVNEVHGDDDDDDCDHNGHHCDDDDDNHTTIRLNGSSTVTVAFDGTYTELGAVCTRDHHDSAASVSGSVNTHVAGTYVVTYRCTHDDETVASVTRTVTVQPEIVPLAACADTSDNDEDGLVDAADPGCHTDGNANNSESYDPADTSEYNVTAGSTQCSDLTDNDGDGQIDMEDSNCSSPEDNNEGNDGGAARGVLNSISSNSPTGEVLGATTSTTSTVPAEEAPSCGAYLTTYMKYGGDNDSEDVKRLQSFLNENLSIALEVTGFFGTLTRDAVKTFQVKYHDDILAPWVSHGLTAYEQTHGTGNVYKTTQRKINMLKCAQLDIPLPDLSQ